MRHSTIAKPISPTDKVRAHNVRFPDSFWEKLEVESKRRAMTIADLIMEAFPRHLEEVSLKRHRQKIREERERKKS